MNETDKAYTAMEKAVESKMIADPSLSYTAAFNAALAESQGRTSLTDVEQAYNERYGSAARGLPDSPSTPVAQRLSEPEDSAVDPYDGWDSRIAAAQKANPSLSFAEAAEEVAQAVAAAMPADVNQSNRKVMNPCPECGSEHGPDVTCKSFYNAKATGKASERVQTFPIRASEETTTLSLDDVNDSLKAVAKSYGVAHGLKTASEIASGLAKDNGTYGEAFKELVAARKRLTSNN